MSFEYVMILITLFFYASNVSSCFISLVTVDQLLGIIILSDFVVVVVVVDGAVVYMTPLFHV